MAGSGPRTHTCTCSVALARKSRYSYRWLVWAPLTGQNWDRYPDTELPFFCLGRQQGHARPWGGCATPFFFHAPPLQHVADSSAFGDFRCATRRGQQGGSSFFHSRSRKSPVPTRPPPAAPCPPRHPCIPPCATCQPPVQQFTATCLYSFPRDDITALRADKKQRCQRREVSAGEGPLGGRRSGWAEPAKQTNRR